VSSLSPYGSEGVHIQQHIVIPASEDSAKDVTIVEHTTPPVGTVTPIVVKKAPPNIGIVLSFFSFIGSALSGAAILLLEKFTQFIIFMQSSQQTATATEITPITPPDATLPISPDTPDDQHPDADQPPEIPAEEPPHSSPEAVQRADEEAAQRAAEEQSRAAEAAAAELLTENTSAAQAQLTNLARLLKSPTPNYTLIGKSLRAFSDLTHKIDMSRLYLRKFTPGGDAWRQLMQFVVYSEDFRLKSIAEGIFRACPEFLKVVCDFDAMSSEEFQFLDSLNGTPVSYFLSELLNFIVAEFRSGGFLAVLRFLESRNEHIRRAAYRAIGSDGVRDNIQGLSLLISGDTQPDVFNDAFNAIIDCAIEHGVFSTGDGLARTIIAKTIDAGRLDKLSELLFNLHCGGRFEELNAIATILTETDCSLIDEINKCRGDYGNFRNTWNMVFGDRHVTVKVPLIPAETAPVVGPQPEAPAKKAPKDAMFLEINDLLRQKKYADVFAGFFASPDPAVSKLAFDEFGHILLGDIQGFASPILKCLGGENGNAKRNLLSFLRSDETAERFLLAVNIFAGSNVDVASLASSFVIFAASDVGIKGFLLRHIDLFLASLVDRVEIDERNSPDGDGNPSHRYTDVWISDKSANIFPGLTNERLAGMMSSNAAFADVIVGAFSEIKNPTAKNAAVRKLLTQIRDSECLEGIQLNMRDTNNVSKWNSLVDGIDDGAKIAAPRLADTAAAAAAGLGSRIAGIFRRQ
jgi:hypothetical protein